MIKIFASILIVFSCTALSFKKIVTEKSYIASLKSLIMCLNQMADNIMFFKRPLYEIIESLRKHNDDVFFKKVFFHLSTNEKITIPDAWEKALEEKLPLCDDAKDSLLVLGKQLGTKTPQQESESISYCIHSLENILCENEQICKKNTKMIKSFGVLFGVMIIILFI